MLCAGELLATDALRRRASPSSDGDMYSKWLRPLQSCQADSPQHKWWRRKQAAQRKGRAPVPVMHRKDGQLIAVIKQQKCIQKNQYLLQPVVRAQNAKRESYN